MPSSFFRERRPGGRWAKGKKITNQKRREEKNPAERESWIENKDVAPKNRTRDGFTKNKQTNLGL